MHVLFNNIKFASVSDIEGFNEKMLYVGATQQLVLSSR